MMTPQTETSTQAPPKKLSMRVYVLPNLVTTGNLFFGFFAIIQCIKLNYELATYSIIAASIFDLLDGRLARLTRATSKFGAEYDSLCDLVSFGVAPAILLYQWGLAPFGRLGWLACFLYTACGALRLARFNVQAGVIEKNYFQGLPIPMAAGIVASSVMAIKELGVDPSGNVGLLVLTFLLAIVMVSNFRYRSFKDLDLKERQPLKYVVLGVLVLIAVALNPEVHLFVLFLTYAVLGAVFGVFRLGKNIKNRNKLYATPAPVLGENNDLSEDEDGEEVEQ